MTFPQALALAFEGAKIRRVIDKEGSYIAVVKDTDTDSYLCSCLAWHYSSPNVEPSLHWTPDTVSLFAVDWIIIETT